MKKRDADGRGAMVSASPHGMALIATDGLVREWNPAAERIFGLVANRVIGQPFSALLGGDDPGMLALLAQWPDLDHEIRYIRGDGTAVDISLAVASIASAGGTHEGYVAAFSDVTKRKVIDEHLRRSQRLEAIARLVGGIAHDFNNLLQVISGRAKLAGDVIALGGDARPHVDEIVSAARLASNHTRQLLAFSQRQELRPHVLQFDVLIQRTERMLKRIVGSGITIVLRTQAGDAQVIADPQQIERLLAHLALNARTAMPEGGTLTIDTERIQADAAFTAKHPFVRPGEYVSLVVSDTGWGMDEPTLLRLFEPFFTTKEPGKGAGLGLASVFGIVKQSGGHIVAESQPGVGSTFRILFPPAPAAAEMSKPARRRSGARGKMAGEAVMIVEDTASVRRVMALALSQEGYDVIEAGDAAEALSKAELRGEALRVLVADVSLPGLSGIELARQLATTHPAICIVLISGYGVEHVTLDGPLKDRAIVLAKPFSIPDFLGSIRDLLDGHPAASAAARNDRGITSRAKRAGRE